MDGPPQEEKLSAVQQKFVNLQRYYQTFLDQTTQYIVPRWAAVVVFYAIFWIRIFAVQGWFIICYALAIYHLNAAGWSPEKYALKEEYLVNK